MRNLKIVAVPNEDGLGPSALLSHSVRALLAAEPELTVEVWNRSQQPFNQNLYHQEIELDRVRLRPVWNLIALAKPGGQVSLAGTATRIGDYRRLSDAYPGFNASVNYDLVLDFGVPAAARWARRHGIPTISLFDHSWSKSLALIWDAAGEHERAMLDAAAWLALLQEIRTDEAHVSQMLLLPAFITPTLFTTFWRRLIGEQRVRQLDAVYGGSDLWTASRARRFLEISQPGPVILVQGGGTPVWDDILRRLVPALLAADHSGELATRGVNIVIRVPDSLPESVELTAALDNAGVRVRPLRLVPGHTVQPLLSGVDFLFTRAGGGTVNDAIAARVPFVCVSEPAQPQVEAILDACVQAGLTQRVPLEAFEQAPLPVILDEHERRRSSGSTSGSTNRMARIPRAAETALAKAWLEQLGSD